MVEVIFSPPRLRLCGGFWLSRPAAKAGLSTAANGSGVDLDSACAASAEPSLDVLALDEALTKLAASQPAKADLVKLRFFAGLTMPEAAAALGISLATAERHWTFARTWLLAEMSDDRSRPVLKF